MAGLLKKKKRTEAEIPTSSMADIAFLLLIFFLVTTTIDVDTGIGMVLPPPLDDQEPPPVKERNILAILVNEQGQLLIEDQISSIPQVRDLVKTHVLNQGADERYAESTDLAIVSIKTSRGTPYDPYIQVLDEVWMAYFEMWDSLARQRGFANYAAYKEALDGGDDEIRDQIKAKISLAEPDPGEA
jgi:biopolymer transport protein ExbD